MANITTISVTKYNQSIITIPKVLADALGWVRGDRIEWVISTQGIILKKHNQLKED